MDQLMLFNTESSVLAQKTSKPKLIGQSYRLNIADSWKILVTRRTKVWAIDNGVVHCGTVWFFFFKDGSKSVWEGQNFQPAEEIEAVGVMVGDRVILLCSSQLWEDKPVRVEPTKQRINYKEISKPWINDYFKGWLLARYHESVIVEMIAEPDIEEWLYKRAVGALTENYNPQNLWEGWSGATRHWRALPPNINL
jgi:hypothetical protein